MSTNGRTTVGEAQIVLHFDAKTLNSEQRKIEASISASGKLSSQYFTKSFVANFGANLISSTIQKTFSAITGSMDAAIKRVDTLRNADKVFEALGYSIEESGNTMKRLVGYLDGLPTSMTTAVSGVQSLAASFGSLEKGTDYFIAMNDAGLAFGATSEMVENAIVQLGQTDLDGPLDAATWNSLRNSGFSPVFAAMAKEAKVTVGQLKEQFGGKGTKTVRDFLNELVTMDKKGTSSMKSLQEMARANTAGIGTAFENVQNRIGKAVAKVIDHIGSENIANAIDGFSKGFDEMANVVIGLMDFVSGNAWVFDAVIAGLTGILAIKFVDEITSVDGALAKLATNAGAFLTMLEAHPIMLAITAVGALGVALVGLSENLAEASIRSHEFEDNINHYHGVVENLSASWDELEVKRQDNLKSGEAELRHYEELAAELELIVDGNGRVKEGYEGRASFITSTLSEALGLEIKQVDGVIQGYSDLQQEIANVVQQKRAKLQIESQEAQYQEALQKRLDLEKELGEATTQTEEASNKAWQAYSDYTNYLATAASKNGMSLEEYTAKVEQYRGMEVESLKNLGGEVQDLGIVEAVELDKKQKRLFEEFEAYDVQKRDLTEMYGKYVVAISQYEDNLVKFEQGAYDQIETAAFGYIETQGTVEDMRKAQLQDELSAEKGAKEALIQLYDETGDETYKTWADAFDAKIEKTSASLESMNAITKNGMEQYNAVTATGLDAATHEYLTELANQYSAVVGKNIEFKDAGEGLVQALANGYTIGTPQTKEAIHEIMDAARNNALGYKSVFTNIGDMLGQGVGGGFAGSNLIAQVVGKMKAAVAAAKAAADIHSPSRVMRDEVGKMMAAGLEVGYEQEMAEATPRMAEASLEILDVPPAATSMRFGGALANVFEGEYTVEDGGGVTVGEQNFIINNGFDAREAGRQFMQEVRRYA